MPFDSQGIASISGNRPVNGQDTDAAQINVPLADIQAMLSQVLLKSGVAPMLGNLNMNNFKIGNLAQATNPEDAVLKSQLDAAIAGLSIATTKTVTVGAAGDFQTLNEALASVSKIFSIPYVSGGIKVEIKLLAGFVMGEQVVVDNLDLGWVTISSEATSVTVDETKITQALLPADAITPIILGNNGAILPVLNVLFQYSNSSTAKDGIAVANGAKVYFKPSSSSSSVAVSGVRNARRGLTILYGAEAVCGVPGIIQGGGGSGGGIAVGPDFSGCSNRALQLQHGAKATLPRVNLSNCAGDNAAYVIWNSFADLYQANFTGHTGSNAACHARDGSVICARESDASNANVSGYHALHAATIDARSTKANNCGSYGYLATGVSSMDATAGSAINAGNRGVWASNGSSIEFEDGVATGCAGTCGVGAYGGGSSVNANRANVNNCTNSGFFAQNGATINADSGTANTCSTGIYCEGSTVSAPSVEARNCTTRAVLSQRGSVVNIRSASLTGGTVYGVECLEGSIVNAHAANATGSGTFGFRVIRGGVINASDSVGSLSKGTNSLDADGIIYK